jgi:hypothetical protein
LINDKNPEVREFVAKNLNLKDHHIDKLMNDEDWPVRRSLATNPNLKDYHIDKLVNEIMVFTWDNYYSNDHVLDGEEWRVTLHYKSGRTRSFSGMNAYPTNYDDFIKLCKEYDFAFDDSYYDFEDSDSTPWYDDFLEEIRKLEGILICPECESDYVVHANPMGYDFMCGNCGHNFIYENGKHEIDFDNEEKKNLN